MEKRVTLESLWKQKPEPKDWGLTNCKRCNKEFRKTSANHLYCCNTNKPKRAYKKGKSWAVDSYGRDGLCVICHKRFIIKSWNHLCCSEECQLIRRKNK